MGSVLAVMDSIRSQAINFDQTQQMFKVYANVDFSGEEVASIEPNITYNIWVQYRIENGILTSAEEIFLKDGVYELMSTIHIDVPGITIKGESKENVRIIQTSDLDVCNVLKDNVTIENITFDARTSRCAFAQTPGVNNSKVNNCIFYGGTGGYLTVFFPGPNVEEGQETLDAYSDDELPTGNEFINNKVICGMKELKIDDVSFSLQSDAEFTGNTIENGMLAVFMTKNTQVKYNTIANSNHDGVFISLPTEDLIFEGNKIKHAAANYLVIGTNGEHGGGNITSRNITIRYNKMIGETQPDIKHVSIRRRSNEDIEGLTNVRIQHNTATIPLIENDFSYNEERINRNQVIFP